MDMVQLSRGYRATTRRQFTFYHSVPRSSWYLINSPRKDKRMNWPWSHPAVLNQGLLHWEASALTTTTIGKTYVKCNFPVFININKQTVSFYHVTYAFQSESTLYSCLNVKELLARSRREI